MIVRGGGFVGFCFFPSFFVLFQGRYSFSSLEVSKDPEGKVKATKKSVHLLVYSMGTFQLDSQLYTEQASISFHLIFTISENHNLLPIEKVICLRF